MAGPAINVQLCPTDYESDYGSDFSPEEEAIVTALLSGDSIEEDNPIASQIERYDTQNNLRLPKVLGREEQSPLFQAARAAEAVAQQIQKSVDAIQPSSNLSHERGAPPPNVDLETSKEPEAVEADVLNPQSPLEQFRAPPKKTFSVTDLVSPAWCELQYYYTLKYHGRKKRTLAMKEGSKVHQQLEDQVHTTVTIDIQTKEDAWGLRIWNVIQGLRTLRSTGLTRELEVWGVVDGSVVNGVIDELSYTCPDVDLEKIIEKTPSVKVTGPVQAAISKYFGLAGGPSIEKATRDKRKQARQKIYIGDVKTRSGRSLPNDIAFRPTRMQLMLYHYLLSSLATNSVEFDRLLNRYGLDGDQIFSDAFIAQVGGLNDDIFFDAKSQPSSELEPASSQDSVTTLLAHHNLCSLWSLMISEFRETIPDVGCLGKVLKAEYRSREDGEIVGVKTIVMDELELQAFISHELEWWNGKREPEGVVVQEAYKCRMCDFADGCEWRIKKVDEAKQKARLAKKRTSAR